MQEKAIIEGFDVDYGRMNAQLGGTLPNLGPQAGGATPYDYIDTATDGATNTIPGTQIGSLNDGTQIWRLDHQGVDTHSIHFHLFNVQVIERVAIDGQIFMPDASELGWKETIRMNPGTDTIIALRPVAPTLPFKIPDSIRPIDPALPLGATFTDSLGTVVTNTLQNFGWEYVWHCHLLEHEENDMMRPFTFMASPAAPTSLTATPGSGSVSLAWHDNSIVPLKATNFFVQRATNAAFTSGVATFSPTAATFVNTPVAGGAYYYRVRAENSVSYSTWSNTVTVSVAGGTGISVTINANPTSVALPRAFILSGVVTPAAPGGIVAVYVLRPGALRWSYSSNRGLNASSQWSYSYTPTLRGTYQFYALYGTTQSRIISVVVR